MIICVSMIVYLISFVSLSLLSLYMATAILMNLVTYKLCTTFSLLSLFILMVGIVSLLILHLLDILTLVLLIIPLFLFSMVVITMRRL